MTGQTLFTIVVSFQFIVTFLYFIVLQGFFNSAKEEDNDLWELMGKPHIFLNNTPMNFSKFMSCLTKSEYLKSNSKRVRGYGILSKTLLYSGLLNLVIILVLINTGNIPLN